MKTYFPFLPILLAAALAAACAADKTNIEKIEDPSSATVEEKAFTAREIIDRNLAATGGEERLRAVQSLSMEGKQGSIIMTPPPEDVTAYFKKPHHFKMKSGFQIVTYDGEEVLICTGEEPKPITGPDRADLEFRIGMAIHCFSLLNWEPFFEQALFAGRKKYGSHEEYILKFPKTVNGEDLDVHIDAKTFLIDRVVYMAPHSKLESLKTVYRFRDYKEVEGIQLPHYFCLDKVGWGMGGEGTHVEVQSYALNPELDDGFLKDMSLDFGHLACKDDCIEGEVCGDYFGFMQTSIRDGDLTAFGVKDKEWIEISVGDNKVKARYIADVMATAMAQELNTEEIHFFRHPRSGYPRLMLISQTVPADQIIAFEKGDRITLTKTSNQEQ
ncbi:MAG: hypothetical protein ACYTG7_14855 [Planctomycetota bacterium]